MLFGVFDGHGGDDVAHLAKAKFKEVLINNADFKRGKYKEAFEQSFIAFDVEVEMELGDRSKEVGTTACVVLLTPDMIYCSNSGDSRAILKSGD